MYDSLVPRPHLRERVWWHLAVTSGFINGDYFLERNFSPPITLQKRQSVVQHQKFLAIYFTRWHSTSFGTQISKLWIFNEAKGISQMSPDPLLVGGVWWREYMYVACQSKGQKRAPTGGTHSLVPPPPHLRTRLEPLTVCAQHCLRKPCVPMHLRTGKWTWSLAVAVLEMKCWAQVGIC